MRAHQMFVGSFCESAQVGLYFNSAYCSFSGVAPSCPSASAP
jgi:hypothetical protein